MKGTTLWAFASLWLLAGCADSGDRKTGLDMPAVGERGVVRSASGGDIVPAAQDEDSFRELTKVAAANDLTGARQLEEAGRIFTVESGTPALSLDVKFPGMAKVRLLSGPRAEQAVWVDVKFFVKQ